MLDQLVFATNNLNKLEEVRRLLYTQYTIDGLSEIGCFEEIPETADTIEGNAKLKASYIYQNYHLNCFADDTGLEVEALSGEPGVMSARYAGSSRDNEANIQLLLKNLNNKQNRNAHFKTVISLVIDGNFYEFIGLVEGMIVPEKRGDNGFGYDSVFMPNGHDRTFAEMTMQEKNKISHRAIAVEKLIEWLRNA